MMISRGFIVYNNNVTGKVTLLANANIVDSEMGGLNVNGDNVTVDNCIINVVVNYVVFQ